MVLQMCLGFMKGDADLAKDLSQEIFINVWNALAKFKHESSYKTWLYRITVNTCLLYIRNNKKIKIFDSTLLPSMAIKESVEHHDKEYNELYIAIGKLSELDRLIIMLVLDELEYEEIAKVMGVNSVNLRVKIHRIKKKLKQLLEQNETYG